MNTARNEVFRNALALDEDDRVELAGLLLSQSTEPADPDREAAWRQELDQRANELDSGEIQAVPWEEVRARLTQRPDADSPR